MAGPLWRASDLMSVIPGATQTRIETQPDDVIAHVSRTMTRYCTEDVNLEQYRGIHTHMVFSESFHQPSLSPTVTPYWVSTMSPASVSAPTTAS